MYKNTLTVTGASEIVCQRQKQTGLIQGFILCRPVTVPVRLSISLGVAYNQGHQLSWQCGMFLSFKKFVYIHVFYCWFVYIKKTIQIHWYFFKRALCQSYFMYNKLFRNTKASIEQNVVTQAQDLTGNMQCRLVKLNVTGRQAILELSNINI